MNDRHGTRPLRNLWKFRILFLFVLPGLAVMIINNYLPMVGLIAAFKNLNYAKGLFLSPFVGLSNFAFLFRTPDVLRVTRNTVFFNLVFILLGLVLSVSVAVCLNELHSKRLSELFQTLFMIPYFLSMVVVAYAVYGFLNPAAGFLDRVLFPMLGLGKVDWYSNPSYWVTILPVVNFWVNTGVGAVIYIASITSIDSQMYEAAFVDGATRLQQLRFITLPSIKATMVILTLLNLGNVIRGNFGLFYQVTMNSAALYPVTDVIDTYVYRSLTTNSDMGMVVAASLYQSVVGCVTVVMANLAVRKVDPSSSLF